jgi:6-phosphogluconolactonase
MVRKGASRRFRTAQRPVSGGTDPKAIRQVRRKTMSEIHWFDNSQQLAPALAGAVARSLRAVLDERPHAVLAVSGGRSPVPVFEALSGAELDWSRVIVTLVDERWVPESHVASNGALVRAHLLLGLAAKARFVPMYTGDASAAEAEGSLAERFRAMPLPFAAVILGMGDDGHTASLFPGSPQLEAGLALGGTVATAPPCLHQLADVSPTERMSLTLPWILHARRIYLQFGGAAKAEVFQTALSGPSLRTPISYVLAQSRTPVDVFAART